MKKLFIFLFLFSALISCEDKSKPTAANNFEDAEFSVKNTALKFQHKDSLAKQWHTMVFEKGGCLGGQQYYNGQIQPESIELVFSRIEWDKFSKNNTKKLTEFLINKLSDTTKTKIHTCPFFAATTGEMAVYSLQHIHKANWYDFPEFKEFKDKEYKSDTDQAQMWLQSILKDKTQRTKLADLYLQKVKQ